MHKYLMTLCVLALAFACNRSDVELPAAASEGDNTRIDEMHRAPSVVIAEPTTAMPRETNPENEVEAENEANPQNAVNVRTIEPVAVEAARANAEVEANDVNKLDMAANAPKPSRAVQKIPEGLPLQPARVIAPTQDVTEPRAIPDVDPSQTASR